MNTPNQYTLRYLRWFLIAILLTSCLPVTDEVDLGPWVYTDLIALDEADSTNPAIDILALYTRANEHELQLRLDLFDHSPIPDFDTYLAIDNQSGGTTLLPLAFEADIEWDYLITIPAGGEISVLNTSEDPQENMGVRVQRDPNLDTIQISINRAALESDTVAPWAEPVFQIQVFLTEPGSSTPLDSLGPVSSLSPTPPQALVLLAFWNVFPAYTPSQALRKWDGAHTGPHGGRHGLHNLLRTAHSHNLPLVLLDLSYPHSLSALEYFGGLDLVRSMQKSALLILPTSLLNPKYSPFALPADVHEGFISQEKKIKTNFDLPSSSFLYTPSAYPPGFIEPAIIFIRTPFDNNTVNNLIVPVTRSANQKLIPIPEFKNGDPQATSGGPSPLIRLAFIKAAQLQDTKEFSGNSQVLVLGGDLPASTWGIPENLRATFRYILAHPWIKVLNAEDLKSLGTTSISAIKPLIATPSASESSKYPVARDEQLLAALKQIPKNQIGATAWQTYYNSFNPVSPISPDLIALRTNYIPHLWSLIEAAHWQDNPYDRSDCSQDYDRDGEPECILASERFLFLIEPNEGEISFGFYHADSDFHQLIGPSSQFISGASGGIFWDLAAGTRSDPSIISGAFFDPGVLYVPDEIPSGLLLISQEGLYKKSYQLTSTGLLVEYHAIPANAITSVKIPLALDPWNQYTSDWAKNYRQSSGEKSFHLAHPSGLVVQVSTTSLLSAHSFWDSRHFFSSLEDPNKDYPPGHFIPFPMSLVEITSHEPFSVWITPYNK